MSFKKLHSDRGETLTEVLCAVVVCTIAVLLLATCAAMAANIGKSTQDTDVNYYATLNFAESRGAVTPPAGADPTPAATDGTVSVSADGPVSIPLPTTADVTYYGGGDIWSYALPSPTPVPGAGG